MLECFLQFSMLFRMGSSPFYRHNPCLWYERIDATGCCLPAAARRRRHARRTLSPPCSLSSVATIRYHSLPCFAAACSLWEEDDRTLPVAVEFGPSMMEETGSNGFRTLPDLARHRAASPRCCRSTINRVCRSLSPLAVDGDDEDDEEAVNLSRRLLPVAWTPFVLFVVLLASRARHRHLSPFGEKIPLAAMAAGLMKRVEHRISML
ncbi:hypothetical protein ACLOJK_007495 [Asimina triloba]